MGKNQTVKYWCESFELNWIILNLYCDIGVDGSKITWLEIISVCTVQDKITVLKITIIIIK